MNVFDEESSCGTRSTTENDRTAPDTSLWKQRSFLGYHCSDGQAGTRNYWIVVPLRSGEEMKTISASFSELAESLRAMESGPAIFNT
jgi:hypothetical protein